MRSNHSAVDRILFSNWIRKYNLLTAEVQHMEFEDFIFNSDFYTPVYDEIVCKEAQAHNGIPIRNLSHTFLEKN